ncbi:hypothetical protein QM565_34415 [Geitlerinema splendidum]|nr:hypothetical protein [Geitlerinema splendidum]
MGKKGIGSWELGVGEEGSWKLGEEGNEGKSVIVLDTYLKLSTLEPT